MVSKALLVAVALQYFGGIHENITVVFAFGGLQTSRNHQLNHIRPTVSDTRRCSKWGGFRQPTTTTTSSWIPQTTATSNNRVCLYESQQEEKEEEEEVAFVEAEDLPAIQALFTKYCDKDGLMTKNSLEGVPMISDMLADEDLLPEELDDIWDAAPKFPDVDTADVRIDVDSFVQIYRDVDDLFEDEDDDEPNTDPGSSTKESSSMKEEVKTSSSDTTKETVLGSQVNDDLNDDDDVPTTTTTNDVDDENVEAELETMFASICDKDGLVSKEALTNWDEIQKLLGDDLLGEDELEDLWNQTQKSPGSSDQLDVDGFLSFNVALDRLFDFEDEDEEDDVVDDDISTNDAVAVSSPSPPPKARSMVEGEDLPPGVLFAALANEDYQVGMEELKWWSELQDMVRDGDLLLDELKSMFESIEKAAGTTNKLDEDGFAKLYQEIEDLFEEVPEDEIAATNEANASKEVEQTAVIKSDLLELLDLIDEDYADGLPCGLESTEPEQNKVLNIVSALEEQPTNIIRQKGGAIGMPDLEGEWDLLYSSSSAMKFNQGLSGLGGSFPNGRFAGLKQRLIAKKYKIEMEYVERIEVTPDTASFDVTVDGDWDIRTSVSLFTGAPSIILNVVPDRVTYGPTSTRADHWKSLGPMNMLDLTYLDEDIRIMRGCTSADTIFIFKRSA